MNGFISRMIARHIAPLNNIVPRLPGKFENGKNGIFQNKSEINADATTFMNRNEQIKNEPINHEAKEKKSDSAFVPQKTISEPLAEMQFDNSNAEPVTSIKLFKNEIEETNILSAEGSNVTAEMINNKPNGQQQNAKQSDNVFLPLQKIKDQLVETHEEFTNLGTTNSFKPAPDQKSLLIPNNFSLIQNKVIPEHINDIKPLIISKINEGDNTRQAPDMEDSSLKNISQINYNSVPVTSGTPTLIEASENGENKAQRLVVPMTTHYSSLTPPSKKQPDIPSFFSSNEANLQPIIKVHIGRIEIKAVNEQPQQSSHTKSNVRKPEMSLNDYLKKRNAGQ